MYLILIFPIIFLSCRKDGLKKWKRLLRENFQKKDD
jgi:hypothetical protein